MVDNYDYWLDYDIQSEAALEKLPKCDCCGEAIQTDEHWEIFGSVYCCECAEEKFKRYSF